MLLLGPESPLYAVFQECQVPCSAQNGTQNTSFETSYGDSMSVCQCVTESYLLSGFLTPKDCNVFTYDMQHRECMACRVEAVIVILIIIYC